MSQGLAIRNHTADALKLTQIDYLDRSSHNDGTGRLAWRPAILLTKRKKSSKPSKEIKLAADKETGQIIEPFQTQQVHASIAAFSETRTNVHMTTSSRLRLILENSNDVAWHVEITAPSTRSAIAAAITDDQARPPYTVIYNRLSSTVTFLDRLDPKRWMQRFPDSVPLSALSIPGTHNSPTCNQALPSVRCQVVPIATQLTEGIRYLDVRVQVDNIGKDGGGDGMQLVHSIFPISFRGPKPFAALIKDVYHFLETNPSETIIISLKREGLSGATDADFAARLQTHYTASPFWHTKPGIPTLGEVRGKIVVLRRFALGDAFGDQGFGVDATDWADNALAYQHGDIHIQDFYSVTSNRNVAKKVKAVTDHLDRAAAIVHSIDTRHMSSSGVMSTEMPPLFINHLSANSFWSPGCWPDKVAARLNPAILAFLCEGRGALDKSQEGASGDRTLGVVVCDWVGDKGNWDLVRAIIGTNSRLLARINGQR